MTREDIIKLAREAGIKNDLDGIWCDADGLIAFAALVVAAERERIIAANRPEIEKINAYIKELEKAVEDEREACAKVCEAEAEKWEGKDGPVCFEARLCSYAIRARGNNMNT